MLSLGMLIALAVGSAAQPQPPADTQPAASPYAQEGPHEVASLKLEWPDTKRDRTVPARIYYPADEESPFPVVIFSHGLGGSCEGYAYLGRHWASHGYVCVHVEHEGSNADVWKGQADAAQEMQRAAKDPQNSINRPKDISFAIDQLKALDSQDGPLKDRLDLDRIAVAGHSFGAFTALAIAGEAGTHASGERSLADPRVKAAIPLSAPVPFKRDRYDLVYGKISIPCLHMTGTLDESPIAFTKADDRRIPYDYITRSDQYLITLAGGDHAVFSGRTRRGRYAEKDVAFQDAIRAATTAFLDAYLKDDAKARKWLQSGGLKTSLGKNGRLEQKRATSQPAAAERSGTGTNRPGRSGEPARPRAGVHRNR